MEHFPAHPPLHSSNTFLAIAVPVKHHCLFPSPHCKPPRNKHPSKSYSFRVSDMQQNCAANLACLPGFDLSSLFLPQIQNDPIYDFTSLDMVDLDPYPYSCNGSLTTVSSVSAAAAAENHQERRGGDERKRRRLASNRESARRSRVRKQRRLDELSLQVAELLGTNHKLLVELNHVIAKHAAVVRENTKLRDEVAGLQKRLSEMEVGVEEAEAEATAGTPDPEVA